MGSRPDLHEEFCETLGTRNVYFQPPESIRMKYDAIRYELTGKDIKRANNGAYRVTNRYDGVVISLDPECTIPDELLHRFPMLSLGKPYTVNNLNHFPFTIYY
jgi:hypothetical protein